MLEGDSNILGDLYKSCKDAKEKIRYAALYAVSRGKDVKTVAEIMDVEESTVYDWIKKWILDKSVSDKPRSGRPQKLTKEDEKEIKGLIEENDPKRYGINASSYTTVELQEEYRASYEEAFIRELQGFWASVVEGAPVRNTIEGATADLRLVEQLAATALKG